MTRRWTIPALVLALVAAASLYARPVRAQAGEDYHRPVELGLTGGAHLFAADHGLSRNQGDPKEYSPAHAATFGLRLGFGSPHLWLEAEATATPTHTRSATSEILPTTDEWILSYKGHLLVDFLGRGAFRPFVLAGYGVMNAVVLDDSVIPSDTDGVIDVGVGAKIVILPGVGVRVDGRLLVPPAMFLSESGVTVESHSGGPDVELLAALCFWFGGQPAPPPAPAHTGPQAATPTAVPVPAAPADPDGDGIAGTLDACPLIAEDKDGFEDTDGCPDPDDDHDGLPDARDLCPDKAGPVENAGCPDADTDGDGIRDRLDHCPDQPEDKDTYQDEDGCPDLDNDSDGVPDASDKCPFEPETKNNYQEDDGCPDEVPAAVKKFTGVIEGIKFKTGSSQITVGSHGILDRAAEVLVTYPDVRIEISGHTDSKGKADYNRDLSARRAQAVKDYLASKGVREDRMTTVGYGPDRPIAENRSDSGRAQNRRTEFKLIGSP